MNLQLKTANSIEISGTVKKVCVDATTLFLKENTRIGERFRAKELYKYVMDSLENQNPLIDDKSKILIDSFSVYISLAATDTSSNILVDNAGYYLASSNVINESNKEDNSDVNVSCTRRYRKKEQMLYPLVARFYGDGMGCKVKITANYRPAGSAKYSIPDVAAIQIHESLKNFSYKIFSVEVKSSYADVNVLSLLQTVNYQMFADYAVIAYAIAESQSQKRDQLIRKYAEKFGIGVLQIVMDDMLFEKFMDNDLEEIDQADVSLEEVYFPRKSLVEDSDRDEFLERFDVTKMSQLDEWNVSV